MPREPVSGVDYNTHSDVQTCLNDIMNAVKGEEVRGSIHDAIALIDDRSVNLEQEIREGISDIVAPVVEDAMTIICPKFTLLEGNSSTCDIAADDLYAAYQAGKTIAPSITYQGPTRYNLWCYNVSKSVQNDTISITVFCVRPYNDQCWLEKFYIVWRNVSIDGGYITFAFNEYQLTGEGGGGSYTEGYGIDITDGIISADAVQCKLRIDPQENVTSSIPVDILYALLYGTASIYEGHTVVFDVSYAGRGTFSNLQAEYNSTKEGGIRLHFHEVTKAGNGNYVIYEFAVVFPDTGYIGTCTHSTITIQPKLTAGDAIDITNNVISIGEPVYIAMTEGANGIVDTSFIVSITEANFLSKFGISVKDLMAILSGSYNVAKLGIKVYDDTSISMDAYLDKIPILDIRYSKDDEESSLSEGATMIFIWDHCLYEFVVNVEYSDEFRGTISKINGHIAKTKVTSNGYGITGSENSISVDTSVIQKKLTSTNAGTGISITNDAQGNPVISLDLPQAEGGGF